MSKCERERDKLKERVLKRIITLPTLGKLLHGNRASRYTTSVRKSPVVE